MMAKYEDSHGNKETRIEMLIMPKTMLPASKIHTQIQILAI